MTQRTRKHGHALKGALLLLLAAAVPACDSDWGTSERPEVTALSANVESVLEGDTVTFTIEASGDATIERIRLALDGAFSADTTFLVDDPSNDVAGTIQLEVPFGTGPSSQLTATAWAIDVAGEASENPRSVMIEVLDATAPVVSATVTPTEVSAGETIEIQVTATDNRGVAVLGAHVTDNAGYDTTLVDTLAVPVTEATRTFLVVAPPLDLAELTVTPFAEDQSQIPAEFDEDAPIILLADRRGPRFIRLETLPDSTIPLGDSLQVTVELEDAAGIQRVTFVAFAYRGDPAMGTDSVVQRFAQKTIEFPRPTQPGGLPKNVTLYPYLQPTANDVTEPIELFVIAEDSLGNVSDTTKLMYVGGPDVNITYPPDNFAVGVGSNFNVRMTFDDGAGLDSAKLFVTGAEDQTFDLPLPDRTDTAFVVERNVGLFSQGTVYLQAWAWNTAEVGGQSRRVVVEVLSEAPVDEEPPVVSLTAERLVPESAAGRVELTDEIRITVSAFDGNSGLSRIGLFAVASRAGVQDTIRQELLLSGSKSLETLTYQVPVSELYAQFGFTSDAEIDGLLPEDLDLRIHGFAADTSGAVACAVGPEEQRTCTPTADGYFETDGHPGLLLQLDVVRGRTVLLNDPAAVIADLVVDTLRERLFMSDITANLVWGLPLHTDMSLMVSDSQFDIPVGAMPWGLFIGERAENERMLIVANSGGTNMSFVDIGSADPAAVREIDAVRLLTPNAVLLEVTIGTDDLGFTRYTEEPAIDFSDRPQFLAQDSLRRIVFSTVPTEAANTSTLRYVITDPAPAAADDQPEVRYVINGRMINTENTEVLAIANVDDVEVREIEGASDLIRFIGHVPGYPSELIVTPYYTQPDSALSFLNDSIQAVLTARGDATQAGMYMGFMTRGSWDLEAIGFSDTTFVAASGDRGRIVIGEGASSPTGQIVMWFAEPSAVTSSAIQIADLINNASEEVLGVALNENGSLGAARGRNSTFFFTPDLRLQGLYEQADEGGAGAAFHPDHDSVLDGGDPADESGFAFTGTPRRSIEVVNTFHFFEVNDLQIRDNIVGPLKVGPPLRSEQTCTGDGCVVAKLYGITDAGGVVVVNVRRRDLQ